MVTRAATRRRARDEDEERPARGRRGRSERSERRSTRRSGSKKGSARRGGRGWDAVSEMKKNRAGNSKEFRVGKEKEVIKFLEDEPFDTLYEHWLEGVPSGEKNSYTCLGEDCPICDAFGDDDVRFKALFNIVDMTSGRKPKQTVWAATPDPIGQIEEAQEEYGDLTNPDLYFQVSKKQQKNKRWSYKLERLRARDLDEVDLEPLEDDELEEFEDNLLGEGDWETDSYEDLEAAVESVRD